LVIAEDLGRIFRRAHSQLFCELCEDYATRLVAINDNVDTGQDGWRVLAGFASVRHELYNADTSKRIRRSLRNRFLQGIARVTGGLSQRVGDGEQGPRAVAAVGRQPAIDGFEYEGTVYQSLGAVAKAITGAHCNGFLRFRPISATSTAVRVGLPQERPAR